MVLTVVAGDCCTIVSLFFEQAITNSRHNANRGVVGFILWQMIAIDNAANIVPLMPTGVIFTIG